jgi:hypothetical protein
VPLDDPDMPMQGLIPSKEELKDFVHVRVTHETPDIVYSILLPDGWCQQPKPPGKPDLSKEGEFVTLGVFTATKDFMPPIVFTVGVRPAPKKGVVAEWLERQCMLQQLALQRMAAHTFPFGPAADAIALQASDLGPMKLRVVMFEDGGRLFALTGMAPLKMWDTVVATLSLAIYSFELEEPMGPTVPVFRKPKPEDVEE